MESLFNPSRRKIWKWNYGVKTYLVEGCRRAPLLDKVVTSSKTEVSKEEAEVSANDLAEVTSTEQVKVDPSPIVSSGEEEQGVCIQLKKR